MFVKVVLLIIFYLINVCFYNVTGARILFVNPTPSISHSVIYNRIIKELSLRGHQVVSLTTDIINNKSFTNLTEIDVHDVSYSYWRKTNEIVRDLENNLSNLELITKYSMLFIKLTDAQLEDESVQKLIRDRSQHFDVVITEWLTFASTYGFAEHFKCPLIGISSFGLFLPGHDTIGNPTHPLYTIDNWQNYVSIQSGFWLRLNSVIYGFVLRLFYKYIYLPEADRIARKHFGTNISYIGDLERQVSIVLTNTNPIFHGTYPKVPAFIEYGGLHKHSKVGLPKDLKQYLDSSKTGFIYFSLGSNIQSSKLPLSKIKIILNAFKGLPYNILWKFETDDLKDLPANVKILKWLPQQDILDHSNIKLFITQGGLQSTEEAISSQVPMLAIPFFADQELNAGRFEALGIGKQYDLDDLDESSLRAAIMEVIENAKYKNNISKLSEVLWDRPVKGLDLAIWWIEYVIRHQGAEALRSPTATISWCDYYLVDVYLFLISTVMLTLYLIYKAVTFVVKNFNLKQKLE